MKILLFSTDVYFLKVFGEYLSRERTDFDLYCYSDERIATEKISNERYDLILCEKGYLCEFSEEEKYVLLGTNTVFPSEINKSELNIYQKADRVIEELEYLLQVVCGAATRDERGKNIYLPFVSTEGGSGKTTLAYLTAAACAKQKKVLYVNLEPLAVTKFLYSNEFENGMEEVLLSYNEENNDNSGVLLNAIKKNSDDVYVFPTLNNIGDYLETAPATILRILRAVVEVSGIEVVIVDLPDAFSNLSQTILSESKKIVWIYADGKMGTAKLESVQKDPYLKTKGILAKSIFVLNRCKSKNSAENVDAAFPNSESLGSASRIAMVLEMNKEFAKGCQSIISKTGIL